MDDPKRWNDTDKDEVREPTSEELQVASIESLESKDDSAVTETSSPEVSAPVFTSDPLDSSFSGASSFETSAPVVTPPPSIEHEAVSQSKAKRFLAAYIVSIFSAISLLLSGGFLGYVLLDHFITEEKDDLGFYFDLAPLYISMMASMLVFGALYFLATQYVAKSASRDAIKLRDWRVYKTIYAFFSAGLLVAAASVLASLLYIPLAQLMIADDLSTRQILIQVLGGIHVLIWIALLIWQERLVKNEKNPWLQGLFVIILAAIIVVMTAIFPVGSKTDERYDHRVESDLQKIASEISTYQMENNDKLPSSLEILEFGNGVPIQNRLDNYKYTVKESAMSQETSEEAQYQQMLLQMQESGAMDTEAGMSMDEYRSPMPELSTQTYQLCATFRLDTTDAEESPYAAMLGVMSGASSTSSLTGNTDSFSKHKTGEVCFDRS
ncbi:MAG: hypothetical protein UY35_C0018G0024 [Candidatus Saccharibacteria bacterium GW2011_GWC2_48_9]|nr:MAG: hypothetical protein UY35_C0018G0024 [Candidatus Saccharibacteria bacterium GW2011_GWC2_48_9]HCH34427.1 hypothetical protein [Candidatus Saccharibacteria bacterium]